MIQVSRIDHINMKVKSLDKTIHFYGELFGFSVREKGFKLDGTPWAIISDGNAFLCIYELGEQERVQEGLRLEHFGFNVKDFEAVHALLKEKQIPINYGGVVESEHSRSLYIDDPNGFEIELSEKVGGGL